MTVQAIVAFSVTFVLVAVLAPALIRYLRRLAYQQHAYEDAPKTHQVKTGTPTMGGLLFLIAPVVAIICLHTVAGWHATANLDVAYAFLIFASAAIGFIDDYAGIRHGRNRGLKARTKFLATALVGVLFLLYTLRASPYGNIDVLFVGRLPVWAWFLLSLAVILATTHAVNLTDGLDGLAAGTIIPPFLVLGFIATVALTAPGLPYLTINNVALVFITAMLGAVLGFLIYNRHPAKIFMGDTGSLALGAALAGAAIITGAQLLLLLIGGVFVAETLSVIIQVTSYKTTKRRVFRMSPLHHHFELGGWPETRVTSSFWLASLFLGIIGFVIVVRA